MGSLEGYESLISSVRDAADSTIGGGLIVAANVFDVVLRWLKSELGQLALEGARGVRDRLSKAIGGRGCVFSVHIIASRWGRGATQGGSPKCARHS